MSSSTGSTMRRPEVRRAAVITHGQAETVRAPLARLRVVAEERGVELVLPEDEVAKHGDGAAGEVSSADLAVVLGGDGTMLRALKTFLGTPVPVFGVNFGRVGFLASAEADELEAGVGRAFAGEFDVVELPAVETSAAGASWQAVNDMVVTSSTLGRMIELGWAIGGEDLGSLPCDGLICSTPSGSTAYNLSNGGPVLVWGLDAMALTFVAPHSLHARPLVVPRGLDLVIRNQTEDVGVAVIVDGHSFAEVTQPSPIVVRMGEQKSLLATLPEATFFQRYRATFVD